MDSVKVVVTGDRDETVFPLGLTSNGKKIEWLSLPVLTFEKLPVSDSMLKRISETPFGWIIFSSSRSVHFWTETLLAAGIDFPLETQVACIGESTANIASQDGYTPDFFPTEPGTETFLAEFADMISNNIEKPSVLIPAAEKGRPDLAEGLTKLGCQVEVVGLYRTLLKEGIKNDANVRLINGADAIVFTSPTSVDSVLKNFEVPKTGKLIAIGQFTADHLQSRGYSNAEVLPEGNFERIGEVLS